MNSYRTRIFDGQIGFGSGSKINADDIPESLTRFWLTNAAQEISGSKIFGDDLDMSFNSIVNVVDPTLDQDVATKKYVDTVSGSIGSNLESNYATKTYVDTVSGSIGQDLNHQVLELYAYVDTASGSCAQSLQSVTNIGNTTTNDITAANLKSNTDIYVNYDGPEGDSYLYFYNVGSPVGVSISWNDSSNKFIATPKLAAPNLEVTGDNNSNDTSYVAMVLHGTDSSPPAASTYPRGTIYIQYTP
ncbi:hypothetical protein LCGC14_0954220 [marine sediment metagenome]|uniref:Uncharacterized protein n=1 Tax=marine sediment metagenome TaxID=412755 RepID=A0A0F9RMT7_9ZZZZ